MKVKAILGFSFLVCFLITPPVTAQIDEEIAVEAALWETLLSEADFVGEERPWPEREAVTRPWLLTMEKDGRRFKAIWKNPTGRIKGYMEGWKWEIAAYRIDRYLGLGMVPPTIERVYKGEPGSLQLYIDYWISYKDKKDRKIKTPSYKVFNWNRALYLQRAFDNLIANVDRHQRNYLITEDWRMILIDHSRSFRTSRKYTRNLIYDENFSEGPFLMKQLPCTFYERIQNLDRDTLVNITGDYLTEKEIEAVLKRRDLIIEWVEARCEKMGRDTVLY